MAGVDRVGGRSSAALLFLVCLTLWSCGKSRHEAEPAVPGDPPPDGPDPGEPRDPSPRVCSGPLDAGPIRERRSESCEASSPRLSLLAGTLGGFGNLDGRGEEARFYSPYAITTDDAGNLFVLEELGITIRRIHAASGDVSTLVLDGPIEHGTSMASDRAGHLYIAEQATILELTLATGTVSLVAGATGVYEHADGRGTEARFADITGIAVSEDYLYVAGGTTIRRVELSTREVVTLAGSVARSGTIDGVGSEAELTGTAGVTLDAGDALYFTDGGSVRELDLTTLEVTTLAGSVDEREHQDGIGVTARFLAPRGITSDCRGNLYVVDEETVRTVALANAQVSTLAGSPGERGYMDGRGAEARFGEAETITSDGENLYVTEYSEASTIRQVAIATGETTTLAGAAPDPDALPAFFRPGALSNDGEHAFVIDGSAIYQAELASGRVTKIDATFPVRQGPGEVAAYLLSDTLPVATDELLVLGNSAIYHLNSSSNQLTLLAGSPDPGSADGVGTDARFEHAEGFVSDGAANLYIAEVNTIRRFSLESAEVTTIAGVHGQRAFRDGRGSEAAFENATALEYDGNESLFIADGKTIRQLRLSSNEVTTFAGAGTASGYDDGIGAKARFTGVKEIALAENGDLYVIDDGRLRKVSIETAEVTTVAGTPAGTPGRRGVRLCPANLNGPEGLTVLPGGQLLISDASEPSLLLLELED
jgi:hypothetical protein